MSIQNIRRSVLMATGVGALALSGLLAGRLMGQMGPHGPRDAGMAAPRMFDRISRRLDLTEDQQARIRAVLKTHAAEIETQVQAGMDARRALHQAVMVQPTDETAIRSLGAQVGTAHAEGALLFAKIRTEVWPVLTADQQARLQSFHSGMRHRGDEAMKSLDQWLRQEN
jgi:Spy/CpxP family protein refolding chaperone